MMLQSMCRDYLSALRPFAARFGLDGIVTDIIVANERGRCVATESEVELLSRACDDERVTRVEVAKLLCKSYRRAVEDGDFDRVKKLRHVGVYSKVSVRLLGEEQKVGCDGRE